MRTAAESGKIVLAIIQADLVWEDRNSNLEMANHYIDSLAGNADLVIFPETFTTGFTMNVEKYADTDGSTLRWMKVRASETGMTIAGSVIIREQNKYYNRLYWVQPDGKTVSYDKRHLFRMGREEQYFTPGTERVIARIGDARILLQICYDLRFPVFARSRGDYDAILYVANWPSTRETVWDILLKARAIENQALVIAANRTGIDGMGEGTCGKSCVIDPKGKIQSSLGYEPGVLIASFSPGEIHAFRNSFPAYKDADDFSLNITN